MSKQPLDQEGADKTPTDASQDRPATSKTPAVDDAPNAKATPTDGKSASDAYAAKNSRSRRRNNKGGANAQEASGPNATSQGTPSTSTVTDKTPAASAPAATSPTGTKASSGKPDASSATTSPTTPPSSSRSGGSNDRGGANGNGKANDRGKSSAHGGSSGGGGGGKIAIVLVLILALALGLVAWQLWQRLDSQQTRIDELARQTQDSATQQSLTELESRLESGESERSETLESTVSELRGELENVQASVEETVAEVLDQLSQAQDSDERDWLHAEAAYLLRLANQRLQLEGDVDGAAALLRTADARLVDADNPALTPVRREIASELAALDAVPRVDRTGIYLALNAQQERVAGLRLSQEIEERAVNSGIEQPPSGSFERQLARFGAELRDLVVVRHHDEALEALITPEQESYLRQSLRLILEQAQLALLKEEQPLFEASIDKALTLLDSYYDVEREETQSVIERLQELKQNEIEPELPDISGSQQAMTRFIDNRFESRRQGGGDE
ncbi:uroporphyrinogen-III C-methyltransferase [Vreelandella sp. EE22]